MKIERFLDICLQEGLTPNKEYLRLYLSHYLFKEIDFGGKSVLDIGGGTGTFSFFAAIKGASRVVCLEPEMSGGRRGFNSKFEQVRDKFSLDNVALQNVTFQDFDSGQQKFDIILLHNSINHLDEEACANLLDSEEARERYCPIFEKLSMISREGTKLIIADCSRRNFFASLGLKNPFAQTIEWEKHQPPECWSRMLEGFGFRQIRTVWPPYHMLRPLARRFLSNRWASCFLNSHFILFMEKREEG